MLDLLPTLNFGDMYVLSEIINVPADLGSLTLEQPIKVEVGSAHIKSSHIWAIKYVAATA